LVDAGLLSKDNLNFFLYYATKNFAYIDSTWIIFEPNSLDLNKGKAYSSCFSKGNNEEIISKDCTDKIAIDKYKQIFKANNKKLEVSINNAESRQITYATSIKHEGKVIAVIGINTYISKLDKVTTSLSNEGEGEASIITDSGTYVVNTSAKDKLFKPAADENLEELKNLALRNASANFEQQAGIEDGEFYRIVLPITIYNYENPWIFIFDFPIAKIQHEVFYIIIITLSIFFGFLTIAIALSIYTANHLVDPIISIIGAIAKIAEGDTEVEIPMTKMRDEVGTIAKAAQIFKINTREIVQAKQRAEAANTAKTDFLANMSHELRTPMHAILSYSKLGLDRLKGDKDPEKLEKYLFNIHSGGERLLKLLNNLLDLARLESGKMKSTFEEISISEIISKVISELSALFEEKQIKIKSFEKLSNTSLVGDKQLITQLLINIFSNAFKFSSKASEISCTLEDTLYEFESSVHPAIMISIADQGVGIPESEIESIFDKFIQSSKTKQGGGGTGLGLAICLDIVRLHNGKIWAENNPDLGAVFKIILPRDFKEISTEQTIT
jgi:signal transduction histidine kinase